MLERNERSVGQKMSAGEMNSTFLMKESTVYDELLCVASISGPWLHSTSHTASNSCPSDFPAH